MDKKNIIIIRPEELRRASVISRSIEEQLRNERPMSQFERAMKELGVEVIHANSP